jgi:hypothetical protein
MVVPDNIPANNKQIKTYPTVKVKLKNSLSSYNHIPSNKPTEDGYGKLRMTGIGG